jgi:hypothetical protein
MFAGDGPGSIAAKVRLFAAYTATVEDHAELRAAAATAQAIYQWSKPGTERYSAVVGTDGWIVVES